MSTLQQKPRVPLDLRWIVDQLKTQIPNLQGVYLFGSYASGDQTVESDIDLAVLAETKIPRKVLQDSRR